MQRNFILTDVMKTGFHQDMEEFISMNSIFDQTFDCTGQYYHMHRYDLDSYDRRFAIIDCRQGNWFVKDNDEFNAELRRRVELLKSQGFVFIKATPWESTSTVNETTPPPYIEVEHVKWTGDCSWFWWYMFRRYQHGVININHSSKKYDALYLNKNTMKPHRQKLFHQISDEVKSKSLVSYWPSLKLPPEYESVYPYPAMGGDQDLVERQYIDTKYSLLSESTTCPNEVFMTERLWKSIMAEHVFVVHGNPLYLQRLRGMGFKTFAKYFDESYDLEYDEEARIHKIASLCDNLKDLNWDDVYLNSKSLRKHNRELFFDRGKLSLEINKTLNLFLEFADRS